MFGLKKPIETTEHTASYYAATANIELTLPPLTESISTDVCVVGGGFSGINTALSLAEKGYKVALLEAHRIGWGATGRNGGQVIGGIGENHAQFEKYIGKTGIQAIYDMGNECVELVKDRVATYNIDCDLTMGYLDVAIKPRHLRAFEEEAQYLSSMGYKHPIELLDAQQVKQQVNSNRYLGGMLNRTGHGHCHALNLCLGEARAAIDLGVQIYEQSKAVNITSGENPVVHTSQGQVRARYVVLCGNAYLGNLAPKLSPKILPASSSVVTTKPLAKAVRHRLIPHNVAVCDARVALDYFRLTADGRLLFGGLANYTAREPSDLMRVMSNKIAQVFPQLKTTPLEFAWSGQLGIGINRMPQLGRLEKHVFYMQAYAGHGVAATHLMGYITAQMIAGQAERFDVFAKIPHRSFPGGKTLRMPSFALAMMYYKMKDALF